MKKLLGIIGLAMLMGLGATSDSEARSDKRVDRRQNRQAKRIRHGVKNGSLTRKEARKLGKQQRRIHRAERRAMSDGALIKKEKVKFHLDCHPMDTTQEYQASLKSLQMLIQGLLILKFLKKIVLLQKKEKSV